jgi:predicted PolB exonuclease-like 3'-5' exonuclease
VKSAGSVVFAVFDIETRVDKRFLNRLFYAHDGLGDEQAWQRFREERQARGASDFPPLALHIPISIAVGQVSDDHVLHEVESLALSDYSEENLVRDFWGRAERFAGCLVTFNGRRFDFPVLELQALRYGIAAPIHFSESGGRARYGDERHLDLLDFLSNRGAFAIRGGLDILVKMIGLPGKVGIDGSQVQELYDGGRLEEIHRYCRADVIQTYFLFLRVELMRGRIDTGGYRAACEGAARFLEELGLPLAELKQL